MVYIIQGILGIYFGILAFQIIRKKRQRLNLIFSGFFISQIIGFIFNMIYVVIPDVEVVKIFHFLANFFVYFALVFILIVNMIILESTIIYSVKRQNRYILLFGILLFVIQLILVLLPFDLVSFDDTLPIWERYPKWHPIFFGYMFSIITIFAILPIFSTSFKIYFRFETKELKKRWRFYLIGSLGLVIFNLYPIFLSNLLNFLLGEQNTTFRLIISILGLSVIIWVTFMYYGFQLKQ